MKTISHDQAFKALQAFIDMMDGTTASDVRFITGLPEDRCEEIVQIYNDLISGVAQ
jgi:hypothetical protein